MSDAKRQKVSNEPVYEFSAGPAVLPPEVLAEARDNLVDFEGCGRSLMELSHRGGIVKGVMTGAADALRRLLSVPDTHRICFMQGGATGQFAAVPLNLAGANGAGECGEYAVTGSWGSKASKEAGKYLGTSHVCTNVKPYRAVPAEGTWQRAPGAPLYLHYCDNETVFGVEFPAPPSRGNAKELVVDVSSNFLTRPIDFAKHGVVYAGTQKNAGVAGLTVVIVREDLLKRAAPTTPVTLTWSDFADPSNPVNTPPVWAIYMAGLVFKWVEKQGGVAEMERRAAARSKLLYEFLDKAGGFYTPLVEPGFRSRTNVVFRVKGGDEALEAKFIKEADARGLKTLKGHRSVGGLRASLYNAMPQEGVEALVAFMREFQKANE